MLRSYRAMALFFTAAGCLSAQVDTTPPKLVGFDFNPKTIDVTAGPQSVTVTVHVTDDLSGVSGPFGFVRAEFSSPSGGQHQFVFFSEFNRVSGTSLDGMYQTTVTLPQFSETGNWTVNDVFLEDAVTNFSDLNTTTLQGLGFPTSLTVNSAPDTTPPQLAGFSFSPAAIDVSAGPQPVTFLIHAKDSPAGVSFGCTPFCVGSVELVSPSFRQYQYEPDYNATMVSGTPQDGVWSVKVTLPRYAEAGVWSVYLVQLEDLAGNVATLHTSDLQSMSFPTNLTVTSNPTDTSPPQLTSLTFGPNFINTSVGPQTITLNLGAKDDLSGLDFVPGFASPENQVVYVYFVSPSGNQSHFIDQYFPSFNGFKKVAGTALNGTWQYQFTMPQFSEAGDWQVRSVFLRDAAGNQKFLSTQDLVSLGLQTDLVIVQPSLQPDGTISTPALGGTVADTVFGARAEVTFPPNVLSMGTQVSIDVFSSDLHLPIPAGFSATGTQFVNIDLEPHPATPLPAPGMTLVLPIQNQSTPGKLLTLFKVDPVTGQLTPEPSVNGGAVTGTVNPDGFSATFTGIAGLSVVVGLVPAPGVPGDVNGDGLVNCTDMSIVKASYGKRAGQPGFDARADVNHDNLVNLLDLAFVSQHLPAGTVCK